MNEKKNNSNDPNEKQPQLEDGTYTFKGKTQLADTALEAAMANLSESKKWKASYDNHKFLEVVGLNNEEIKYVYHELSEKGLIENEDGSDFNFDEYFKADDKDDEEISLDGLDDFDVPETWDEDMEGLEEFGASESFDEKPKIQLEGQKADIFNAAGEQYGLSDEKLQNASQEQIDALQKALEDKANAESSIELLKKQIEETANEIKIAGNQLDGSGLNNPLYGVFKDKTIYEKDYEEYKYKLAAKKDYYQQIIDDYSQSDTAKEFAKNKLKEIENYEIAASNFDIGSQNELKNKIDELGKKFASLLEQKKADEETISKSREVIKPFVDENAPYGDERRKNALSFGFNDEASRGIKGNIESGYEESLKYLSDEAKKQWNEMTNEEKEFVNYYTGSYHWVNEPLRGVNYTGYSMPKYTDGKIQSSGGGKKGFIQGTNAMTEAIAKCKLTEDMWFQRWMGGLDIGFGNSLVDYVEKNGIDSVVGLTFRHKNFASMGASKGTGYGDKTITLNLYCPKGVECHYIRGSIGGVHNENEILLNRGYSMRIRKAEKKGVRIYLDVDVILGSNTKEVLDQDLQDALNYV